MKRGYQKLLASSGNYVGFGFIHYLFSSLGQTFFLSVFVKYFVEDTQINNESFSVIYASATLSGAVLLPFLGKLVDRVKLRRFSLINGIAISLFCVFVSFSSSGLMLFVALLGLRLCGQGLMPLIGSTSIARHFEKERGAALSLSSLGLSLGETAMPALAVFLIAGVGWQAAWQLLAAAVVIVFMPAMLLSVKKNDSFQLMPETTAEDCEEDSKTRWQVLKDRRFLMIIPSAVFIPFFMTGLFIHHNLLADIKGWTLEWLATCFIGYGVVKIITTFIAGSLVDRFTARRLFPFHALPMALGVFLILMGNSPLLALAYLCLTGMSASLMSITTTAMWTEIYGYRNLGAIKSMVTTLVVFSSAVGPIVLGVVLNSKVFWLYGLLGMVILMLVLSGIASAALTEKKLPKLAYRIFRVF